MTYKHGMYKTKEFRCWCSMIERCSNPNCKDFKNYGGRGIFVCDSWKNFINFYNDMGDIPKGLTIERKDNNKGYSKDNCKWATRLEQIHSKRQPVYKRKSLYRGVRLRVREIGLRYEVSIAKEYIGTFLTAEEAAKVYDKKAKELYGEKAILNFK